MIHLDRVAALLGKLNVQVVGLLDSPIILDTQPYDPSTTMSLSTMLSNAYDYFKTEDEAI